MGMFDYVSGLKVKCPVCGKTRDRKWQTKAFVNQLITYKIGEKVKSAFDTFECIGTCPVCRSQHIVRVQIKDDVLTDDYVFVKY